MEVKLRERENLGTDCKKVKTHFLPQTALLAFLYIWRNEAY